MPHIMTYYDLCYIGGQARWVWRGVGWLVKRQGLHLCPYLLPAMLMGWPIDLASRWMDGWMDGWVDGWMGGWMDGQNDALTHWQTDRRTDS